jgi:hypothetical protein
MSATNTTLESTTSDGIQEVPNGPVAAAILACGVGTCVLGTLAVAADGSEALARRLVFYAPTGPLSGVTTTAMAIWLVVWFVLSMRWRARTVSISKVNAVAFILLALALLLTFPPFGDLILGR